MSERRWLPVALVATLVTALWSWPALAVFGAVARPRRALPWLLLGLVGLTLALGHAVSVGGHAVYAPASVVAWIAPPLRNIHSWWRMACVLSLPLAVAAGLGAEALAARSPKAPTAKLLLATLTALVVVDQATWPRPWSWEPPTFDVAMPRSLEVQLAKVPEGALLELPVEVGINEGVLVEVGFYALWQLQHRRPISATPDAVADRSVEHSVLTRYAFNRQFHARHPDAPTWEPPLAGGPPLSDAQVRCGFRDVRHLRELGFAAVVVHRDRDTGPEVAQLLEASLGRAPMDDGVVATWDLSKLQAGPESRCPLPFVHERVEELLGRVTGDRAPPVP